MKARSELIKLPSGDIKELKQVYILDKSWFIQRHRSTDSLGVILLYHKNISSSFPQGHLKQ